MRVVQAQEASQVSFLSVVKSMKGCWSLGLDDQVSGL
jgi:hypothetical protein